jgi:hypothetical protein
MPKAKPITISLGPPARSRTPQNDRGARSNRGGGSLHLPGQTVEGQLTPSSGLTLSLHIADTNPLLSRRCTRHLLLSRMIVGTQTQRSSEKASLSLSLTP